MPATYATYRDLANRTVVVTGGGSGIGAAIVTAFVAQGARVGFLDIDRTASEALVDRLGSKEVCFEHCDLRDIDALKASLGAIADRFGAPTVLVNNAARDDRHALPDVTPEYWDERFATNLRHQFFAAQALAPGMAAAGGGSIVNMGSVSWMVGQGGMPCYTTAKSAVQGLTRALARDLGPDNIRVNAVVPGWIMTDRQVDLWLTPEGEAELMARQCLKRKLQPIDIARVVLFFASEASGACTNQSYVADGGWV